MNNFRSCSLRSNSIRNTPSAVVLHTLSNGTRVLLHIQLRLGLSYKIIRIDDDLNVLNTKFSYEQANQNTIILFDEVGTNRSKHKVIVVQMHAPFGTVSLRDLKDNAEIEAEYTLNPHIQSSDRGHLYNYALSLCAHSGLSLFLCSLVIKKMIDGNEKNQEAEQEMILFSEKIDSEKCHY